MSEHTPTPFSLKRDLKGNPQLAGYGGLTVMASFHPAGFPTDEEMEHTAIMVVRACNSHEALVAALNRAHTALCSIPKLEDAPELNAQLNEADDIVIASLKGAA